MKNASEEVLDASALIALMREEKGAERVAAVIDHAVIGAVNLAQVTSKLVREGIAIGVVREGSRPSSWMSAPSIGSSRTPPGRSCRSPEVRGSRLAIAPVWGSRVRSG